jgi:hypothetical protein
VRCPRGGGTPGQGKDKRQDGQPSPGRHAHRLPLIRGTATARQEGQRVAAGASGSTGSPASVQSWIPSRYLRTLV